MVEAEISAAYAQSFGLAAHFFGYECARASSMALISRDDLGLGSHGLSYTVLVGSPLSAMVLYLYARSIKNNGAQVTQRLSNVACFILFGIMSFLCSHLTGLSGQVIVVSFYAFREVYVTLLSTQQWSFIASMLNKTNANYLVKFSGLVSIASAVGGVSVEYLVKIGGVHSLLITALVCQAIAFVSDELAYVLLLKNQRNDASPDDHDPKVETQAGSSSSINPSTTKNSTSTTEKLASFVSVAHGSASNLAAAVKAATSAVTNPTAAASATSNPKDGPLNTSMNNNHIVEDSSPKASEATTTPKNKKGLWADFRVMLKYRTLQLLFAEAIVHQCCANMLNLMFHEGLRLGVPIDAERAVVVGRFFASINVVSCLLQCLVLPGILTHSTLPSVLVLIPLIVFFVCVLAYFNPCLLTTMLAFGALKVLEYSINTAATEMIYQPMTYEARYLGKELIKFFGQKLGRSGSQLVLTTAMVKLQPSLATQSMWCSGLAVSWGAVMILLSNHLLEREAPLTHSKSIENIGDLNESVSSSPDTTPNSSTDSLHLTSMVPSNPSFSPSSSSTNVSNLRIDRKLSAALGRENVIIPNIALDLDGPKSQIQQYKQHPVSFNRERGLLLDTSNNKVESDEDDYEFLIDTEDLTTPDKFDAYFGLEESDTFNVGDKSRINADTGGALIFQERDRMGRVKAGQHLLLSHLQPDSLVETPELSLTLKTTSFDRSSVKTDGEEADTEDYDVNNEVDDVMKKLLPMSLSDSNRADDTLGHPFGIRHRHARSFSASSTLPSSPYRSDVLTSAILPQSPLQITAPPTSPNSLLPHNKQKSSGGGRVIPPSRQPLTLLRVGSAHVNLDSMIEADEEHRLRRRERSKTDPNGGNLQSH